MLEAALNGDDRAPGELSVIAYHLWSKNEEEVHLINAWVWASIAGLTQLPDFKSQGSDGRINSTSVTELLSESQLSVAREVKNAVLIEIHNRKLKEK